MMGRMTVGYSIAQILGPAVTAEIAARSGSYARGCSLRPPAWCWRRSCSLPQGELGRAREGAVAWRVRHARDGAVSLKSALDPAWAWPNACAFRMAAE